MKKLYILIIFSLLANFTLFADQVVSSQAPDYVSDITFEETTQTAIVLANADAEDYIVNLYYNGSPLDDGATINKTADNEELLLNQSWEISPFSFRVSGTDSVEFSIGVELQVGFFQLGGNKS